MYSSVSGAVAVSRGCERRVLHFPPLPDRISVGVEILPTATAGGTSPLAETCPWDEEDKRVGKYPCADTSPGGEDPLSDRPPREPEGGAHGCGEMASGLPAAW